MRLLILAAAASLAVSACHDDSPDYNSSENVTVNSSATIHCPSGSTYDADAGKCLDQN
jgi:hypothetical protein